MKDGAIVCNSGHFNVEINLDGLAGNVGWRPADPGPTLRGRIQSLATAPIYILGEGRLINLAAAEGHPASVMDMSFANQALGAEYMMRNVENLCGASLYYTGRRRSWRSPASNWQAMGIKD